MLSTFAGGRVFGVRTGSEPPQVLALHGWGGSHLHMTQLVAGRNAISLDLPGFGASPGPDEVWGAAKYAEVIAPVLDEFEAPAVIVGFSFGGRVAVELAVLQPTKAKALVLTGVPLLRRQTNSKISWQFRALKAANRLRLVSDARMEVERRKRGSTDYRAATGVMRDVLVKVINESYEDVMRRVTCPVELVWGERDTEAPLWIGEDARKLFWVRGNIERCVRRIPFSPDRTT